MEWWAGAWGEAAALAVDAAALALCLRHLLRWRSALADLRGAPSLEIDTELRNKVAESKEGALSYCVVRGVVRPLGDPLRSMTHNDVTGVVKRLTIREHVAARTSAGFWSDEARTIYQMQNVVPFVLTGNGAEVEVIDALEANVLDMDVITDHFEPLNPSLLDHVWDYFSGVRQRGLQTTEEILRDGTVITAIGELTGKNGENLKIQSPKNGSPLFLVTSTKDSLIKKINESQNFFRILVLIFGSVAIVLSSRMIIKYLRRKKKLKEEENLKKQLAVSRKERRKLARDKNLTDLQLCVICSDNPKEIILLPCGHVSLCENCSDNIHDNCPICRMKIESKAAAFIT